MPQDPEITTFQFLEEIQKKFLQQQEDGNLNGAQYDTRRVINFFDNTASLQIITSSGSNGSNGSTAPIATLSLQQVAQKEDSPTFAINLKVAPQDRMKKVLVMVADENGMNAESEKIMELLKKDISDAATTLKEQAVAPVVEAPAPTPAVEATPPPIEEPVLPTPEEPVVAEEAAPEIDLDSLASAPEPTEEAAPEIDLDSLASTPETTEEAPPAREPRTRRRRRDRES